MKMSAAAAFSVTLIALILVNFTAALKVGFYKDKNKCGESVDVEKIVSSVVKRRIGDDPTIAPALIRMFFHDCFVQGCDASLLLNTTSNSERNADPNKSVRGYEVIDEAKAEVEKACKGVVSCADIIALAARDAVISSRGEGYSVETGRRDGLAPAAIVNLPSPRFSVDESVKAFADRDLTITDMVVLLGAHSIGVTHCSHFKDRLYNFNNQGKEDLTMDPTLLNALRLICPQSSSDDRVANLDQNQSSSTTLDSSFYKQIMAHRGVLQIDQELALDFSTNATVESLANTNLFPSMFGKAMVKLGTVGVLEEPKGEIRKVCFAPNGPNPTPNTNTEPNDNSNTDRSIPFLFP
ncbi:hypothetical protein PTKIN_Ptkin11bG0061800 [Pterospermum kingtungense]